VSDNEHFLSRWSRRKQEAKQPEHADGQAPADAAAGTEVAATVPPAVSQEPVEKFDPESLPPIDMIEATTDVRAFLTKGVPADLTKAALRRAWSSDPAIRDFVGLSENAWDFNAPETVPGFGGALPADEVQRILAQMMPSEVKPESPEKPDPDCDAQTSGAEETGSAQAGGNSPHSETHAFVKTDDESARAVTVQSGRQHTTIENNNEDVAVQNTNNSSDLPATSPTRPAERLIPK
jgi:hypothetical protein